MIHHTGRETQLMINSLLRALVVLLVPSISSARAVGIVEFVPVEGKATDAEVKAIARAGKIANVVKNSDCFRTFMATRKLLQTNGRTSEEVASHLQEVSGRIPVEFYFRCLSGSSGCGSPTSAVAYRLPPDNTIYINLGYYKIGLLDFDIYELAGSLAHEAIGHALGGYQHSFEWSPVRDFSVPYSISGASHESDDAFQHCRQPLGYGH